MRTPNRRRRKLLEMIRDDRDPETRPLRLEAAERFDAERVRAIRETCKRAGCPEVADDLILTELPTATAVDFANVYGPRVRLPMPCDPKAEHVQAPPRFVVHDEFIDAIIVERLEREDPGRVAYIRYLCARAGWSPLANRCLILGLSISETMKYLFLLLCESKRPGPFRRPPPPRPPRQQRKNLRRRKRRRRRDDDTDDAEPVA